MQGRKKVTLRVGFEPTRGDPIGFVQRLNHSAIAALEIVEHDIPMKLLHLVVVSWLQQKQVCNIILKSNKCLF